MLHLLYIIAPTKIKKDIPLNIHILQATYILKIP